MGKTKLGYGHGTGIPSPVDVHVGARLRVRRTLLGMSQTTLGDAIGLTFQQVQKYERGSNRISASRLFALTRVLDVPIQYFFDDMPTAIAASSPAQGGGKAAARGKSCRVTSPIPWPSGKRWSSCARTTRLANRRFASGYMS